MKRKITKKSMVCALITCAALCFCACGGNEAETPDTNVSGDPAPAVDEAQRQEIDSPEEDAETPAENEDQGNDTKGSAETDITVSSTVSSVTVTMETPEVTELTTGDGVLYYTIAYSYPVVSIDGNETATEKINADIRSRVDKFTSYVSGRTESVKEDFDYMLSEYPDDIPMPYSSELSYVTERADDNVISFAETSYEYMGGAHGLQGTTGINYDTRTGDLITFDDLSSDPDAFRADTLAYNQELARTEYYSMQLFNTDDITNGTLEEVLYADSEWYLSPSGLVFLSNPYLLAPYAAGVMEFIIPYSVLTDMGFKEAYTYTGRQIVKLFEDNPYSTDLNGDGSDDSIVYSNTWVSDNNDDIGTLTYLTINDFDFRQNGTDDVKEQLASATGLQFWVYDLDVNDNYVELAAIIDEWSQSDEDGHFTSTRYSKFYRYTEDGFLIYLGQVTGDITDPMFIFAASDLWRDS